jgi:hypothetical protein
MNRTFLLWKEADISNVGGHTLTNVLTLLHCKHNLAIQGHV